MSAAMAIVKELTEKHEKRIAELEDQLDVARKANAEWAERYRTAPSTERERYWQDQYTEMNIEVKRLRMLLEAADIDPDENH